VRCRATILLLSDQGFPVEGISGGSESAGKALKEKPRSGRPPIADGEYLRDMLGAVGTPPEKLGYAVSVWIAGRLADHLARLLGKRLSAGYVEELLKGCGYVWGRPRHILNRLT